VFDPQKPQHLRVKDHLDQEHLFCLSCLFLLPFFSLFSFFASLAVFLIGMALLEFGDAVADPA